MATRAEIIANTATQNPDNTSGLIEPSNTRNSQDFIANNVFVPDSDDSDNVTEGATNLFLTTAERSKVANLPADQNAQNTNLQNQIDALDGSVIIVGNWDASSGTFPDGSTNTTPAISPIKRGYKWISTSDGVIDGVNFNTNDQITALVDNPSNTTFAGNWIKQDFTDNVLSVNGKTGAVVLDLDDIADTASREALTTTGQTITGAKTFSNEATFNNGVVGFRPIDSTLTAGDSLENLKANFFIPVNSSSGAVAIDVSDTANSTFAVATEFEFYAIDLTNDIEFTTSGSQVVQSKDGNLKIDGQYSAVVLKKVADNTWALIGSLKA